LRPPSKFGKSLETLRLNFSLNDAGEDTRRTAWVFYFSLNRRQNPRIDVRIIFEKSPGCTLLTIFLLKNKLFENNLKIYFYI
jgi:hypothetical protein